MLREPRCPRQPAFGRHSWAERAKAPSGGTDGAFSGYDDGQLQAVPLTLNPVGDALLDDQVPWKPKAWLPPGGMLAL